MNKNTKYLTKIGMLLAVAVVLMYLEIPLPMFPPFLKIELSDVPALLGGFALGPLAAVIIELLKNVIHFIIKNDGTGGIGNLANFIVGCALCVPASIIYIKHKSKKSAFIGLSVGVVSMIVISILANYFIILPLYGLPAVEMRDFIVVATLPFNAIKAVLVAVVTLFVYKPLSRILHK